jgi:heat shock protein HslJ
MTNYERGKKMKKTLWIVAVLSALAILAAACAPTGGEPESIASPTLPADTQTEETEGVKSNELEDMRWVLVSYQNAAGETVEKLADTDVWAEFNSDGQVGGRSGCNNFFASYTVDEDSLTISQAGSTMMACEPPEIMEQEADFLAALQSAATYTIDGDQLQIGDAEGTTVLTFTGQEPTALTGTTWTANMVNNGAEAVTNLVTETTITAVFTADGKLNGSAGCNNYMTSYTLDGDNIAIEPPATTRKLCPEPTGIMEQEAAFTTMLPQAATYSISGDTLELRTADGALIASFTAAR